MQDEAIHPAWQGCGNDFSAPERNLFETLAFSHAVCYNIQAFVRDCLTDGARGISTVGSALHSHCRGQRFESAMLHHKTSENVMLSDVFILSAVKKRLFHKKEGVNPSDFRHFRSCGQTDQTSNPNAFFFVKRAFGCLIAFREIFRFYPDADSLGASSPIFGRGKSGYDCGAAFVRRALSGDALVTAPICSCRRHRSSCRSCRLSWPHAYRLCSRP